MSDPSTSKNVSTLEMLGREGKNNEDSTINNYGKTLLDLCIKTDLRILNGRTLGNLPGTFTSFQYNGKSVVDYIIMSEKLLTQATNMTVSPPNHLSDHSPINMQLKIKNKTNIGNNDISPTKGSPKTPFG